MSDFMSSLKIAASGLHAQNARMRVIAENIANADSAGKTPGEDPYRRRIPTFKAVMDDEAGGKIPQIGRLALDQSDFNMRYEPGHPAADEKGYVKMPNVNVLVARVHGRVAGFAIMRYGDDVAHLFAEAGEVGREDAGGDLEGAGHGGAEEWAATQAGLPAQTGDFPGFLESGE